MFDAGKCDACQCKVMFDNIKHEVTGHLMNCKVGKQLG